MPDPFERRTGTVHFVDKPKTRHVETIGLAPHGFGLRLDAGHRIQHHDGPVQDTQRTFHFKSKIDVARGVDEVDQMVFPFKTDGGAVDGDASFAFLRQKIQDGVAIVHRSYGSGQGMAGVMKNAFAEGGFAGVDVGQNANVAYFVHGD